MLGLYTDDDAETEERVVRLWRMGQDEALRTMVVMREAREGAAAMGRRAAASGRVAQSKYRERALPNGAGGRMGRRSKNTPHLLSCQTPYANSFLTSSLLLASPASISLPTGQATTSSYEPLWALASPSLSAGPAQFSPVALIRLTAASFGLPRGSGSHAGCGLTQRAASFSFSNGRY